MSEKEGKAYRDKCQYGSGETIRKARLVSATGAQTLGVC